MNQSELDHWEAVLQGRTPATDRDTREAQAIRDYYEATLGPKLAPREDPARERRLRSLVEAQLGTQASQSSTPKPSMPQRVHPFKAWLDRLNLGWPALGAAAAAVVLGVLVGPIWQSQTTAQDEWVVPKSPNANGASSDGTIPKGFEPGAPVPGSPQDVAEQIRGELAKLGIVARIGKADDGWRVAAEIRPEQRGAAVEALKPFGITVPGDGRLKVLIR